MSWSGTFWPSAAKEVAVRFIGLWISCHHLMRAPEKIIANFAKLGIFIDGVTLIWESKMLVMGTAIAIKEISKEIIPDFQEGELAIGVPRHTKVTRLAHPSAIIPHLSTLNRLQIIPHPLTSFCSSLTSHQGSALPSPGTI